MEAEAIFFEGLNCWGYPEYGRERDLLRKVN
jgi:hypothetical protein